MVESLQLLWFKDVENGNEGWLLMGALPKHEFYVERYLSLWVSVYDKIIDRKTVKFYKYLFVRA